MAKGFVKQFIAAKGYGFVGRKDGGTRVFIHHLALEAARVGGLKDGQDVKFDIETDGNGNQYVANLMLA